MTSASRSNRGGGGGGGQSAVDSVSAAVTAAAAVGQSALVAAAVASMANTQPLALTKDEPVEIAEIAEQSPNNSLTADQLRK